MKQPIYAWKFLSGSSSKIYETLRYTDNSLSCDCPGWTRRCVGGQRTCKHVRAVQLSEWGGIDLLSHGPVGGLAAIAKSVKKLTVEMLTKPPPKPPAKPTPVTHQPFKRKLNV